MAADGKLARSLTTSGRYHHSTPTHGREAVILRETSFKELARGHGMSEDACRERFYRTLEKLASLLTKRGILIPPAKLGTGMGACLNQDALLIASESIAKVALTSTPATESSILAKSLLGMDGRSIDRSSPNQDESRSPRSSISLDQQLLPGFV